MVTLFFPHLAVYITSKKNDQKEVKNCEWTL